MDMDAQQIISLMERYKKELEAAGIPKIRVAEHRYFRDVTQAEALAHAHYACDRVIEFARDPAKLRKTGSHLTVVQMCLSIGGWYTRGELMNHNRPVAASEQRGSSQNFTQGITNFMEPAWSR